MRGTECNLLRLGEELVNISVEDKFTNVLSWYEIFGPDLCGVENVEIKLVFPPLGDDLDTEFPFGVGAGFDGFIEVFAVEVRVLPAEFECFVPDEGVYTKFGGPDEFDKMPLSLAIEQCKS